MRLNQHRGLGAVAHHRRAMLGAQRLHRLASALDHHHRHLPRQQRIGNARAYPAMADQHHLAAQRLAMHRAGQLGQGIRPQGQPARPAVARARKRCSSG